MKTTAGSCAWSFVPSLIEPMLKTGANQADLDGGTLQKDIGVAQHNMATGTSRMYPIHMGVGNATYHLERKQQVATTYKERRRIQHIGWLRSAVLGAKDGITSNGSLILGAAAAHATHANILLSGIAVLVGGAMTMATLKYVSVSSESDTEKAALAKERAKLESDFENEYWEPRGTYVDRGLDLPPGRQAAHNLIGHDSLGTRVRDELRVSDVTAARPRQAALGSARNFAAGAALPLAVAALAPERVLISSVAFAALASLVFLGGLGARIGGANILPGVVRATSWSALAMGVAAGVGAVFGWQA
jgi:VIT1/CCC1 family predicted Fe2+/Mn2+ transporter